MPRRPKTALRGKNAKPLGRRAVARMVQIQTPTAAKMRARSRRREYWVVTGRGLCFDGPERKTMGMSARMTISGPRYLNTLPCRRQTLPRRIRLSRSLTLLLFLYMMTTNHWSISRLQLSWRAACIFGYQNVYSHYGSKQSKKYHDALRLARTASPSDVLSSFSKTKARHST